MGKGFKDCECDIFIVGEILDGVITFKWIQPFF